MAEDRIDLAGLPYGLPGSFDTVAGVDTATGMAKQFPMPQAGEPKDYQTRADLPSASGLPDGTAAHVNNDPNPDNNGRWAVFGGTWVKSADRVSGLEGRIGEAEEVISEHGDKLEGQLDRVVDDDILLVTDKNGLVTLRQSADGGLHLPGIETSLQEAVLRSGAEYAPPARLVDFEDKDGLRVSSILTDGDLSTPRFPSGIGKTLGKAHAFPMLDRRFFLSPDSQGWVDELLRINGKNAGVPHNMLPQSYTVRDEIVQEFVLPPQTEYHPIDTPYGRNDRVVHPYIIEFRTPFRGYRYLMALTPYNSLAMENPVVYGGNDLRSWEMLDGFKQPLAEPLLTDRGAWLSDVGLAYDPTDGSLVCYWLDSVRYPNIFSSLVGRKTWDGYSWTDEFPILPDVPREVDGIRSPSLLFDPSRGVWMLWVFAGGPSRLREAPSLSGPWSEPVACTGLSAWHGEVKYVGDKFLSIMVAEGGAATNYWLAISSDGVNFTPGPGLFSSPQDALYKPSFLPVLDGDQIALDVLWTTNLHPNSELVKRIFVARTNFVDIED